MKSCCDGIAEGSNSLRTTIDVDVVIGITRDHIDALEWFDSYYQFIVSEQRLMCVCRPTIALRIAVDGVVRRRG